MENQEIRRMNPEIKKGLQEMKNGQGRIEKDRRRNKWIKHRY